MEEQHYKIVVWLKDYFTGRISPQELKELMKWVEASPDHQDFFECLKEGKMAERENFFREINLIKAFNRFEHRIGRQQKMIWKRWIVYAACFILPIVLAFGIYLNMSPVEPLPLAVNPEIITPGNCKAVLTLANGESVVLSDQQQTKIQISGQSQIENTGRKIVYPIVEKTSGNPEYNYLHTPRGGEYQLELSDGSRVFLNADSKLKYPVVFSTDKREVYVSGEAYFEIATDSLRPFYVNTGATRIRVYGTVFNVNTHIKDKIQTVLVSGQIGISGNVTGKEYRMKPSELSEFSADGIFLEIRKVQTRQYTAWHFGRFSFDNQRLEEILDQLALWYDVEVFYANPSLKEEYFTGNVKRYEQIEVILDAIHQITGAKFHIQGKTISVMD